MQSKAEIQQGWEFAAGILGADIAAHMGQEYVSAVEAAIKQLEENINNHPYRNLGIEQLQGYMLEEWGPEHSMWMRSQLIRQTVPLFCIAP